MDPCTLQQIRAAFGVSVDGFLALLAGVIAYAGAVRGARRQVDAMRAQLAEAQRQNLDQKHAGRLAQSRDQLAAATLVGAALEVLRYDLDGLLNLFDPGALDPAFYTVEIAPDRARWILDQWRPPAWEPLFTYVGRLSHEAVEEFFFVLSISERLPQNLPRTYGDLRDRIKDLKGRVIELKARLQSESEAARQFVANEDAKNPL
ncbi:MAG TPA: hypothetical protein VGG60_10765 [Candidatus Binataceae bacterium]|jgi:hypothetical protein